MSSSFKAGPFQGALLSPREDPAPAPQPTSHPYTPSQLRQILKATPPRSVLHFPHSQSIKSHLEELLYPLKFSEQLACRMVSSKNLIKSQASLDALRPDNDFGFAMLGEHNTKLSFMGRRAAHFALSTFLAHAPVFTPLKDPENRVSVQVIEEALLTKFVLGQFVGKQWELEKVMRWRQLEETPGHNSLTGTGLWTARGHVVEAILGSVMIQHGTRLCLAVFNSLVLPHLSLRLDPAFLPAIQAVQVHDRELEKPEAGLVDWSKIDVSSFVVDSQPVVDSESAEEAAKSKKKMALG